MMPSLFSISYAGFWGQSTLSLIEFIKHAGKLGYSSVMIAGKRPHLSPLDATAEFVKPLQEALAAAGVRCDVLGAYTNLSQPSSVGSEVPTIELQIAYRPLCHHLFGMDLGAPVGGRDGLTVLCKRRNPSHYSQPNNRCTPRLRS